jgi:type IVB pilus formation R64 PilN family outer membrane protein
MKSLQNIILGLASMALTACGTALHQDIEEQNSDRVEESKIALQLSYSSTPTRNFSETSPQNKLFVKVRPLIVKQQTDKELLELKISINRQFQSINDFSDKINELTGIQIQIDPDLQEKTNTENTAASARLKIKYEGPLKGLLNVMASRLSVNWEYLNGTLHFQRYVTRTFRIAALPGDVSMDAKVGSTTGSGGGTSGATGGPTSSMKMSNMSVLTGIENTVKTLISSSGKLVVSPALGTLTVTDYPKNVSAVKQFIEDQNKSLTRQVTLNVRVLSIDIKKGENFGINWNSIYSNLQSQYGLTFNSATQTIAGAGNMVMSIPGAASSEWAGSTALIQALSTQGRVSTLTSASLTTLNNQPAPLQLGKNTSYLASSQTTIAQGVSSTTLTPGNISSGFSLSLLPHIIDEDRMMLQYAIDISSLLSLNTISTANSMIQAPDVDIRTSLQRVLINSGDTLVVAGFENSEIAAKQSGAVHHSMPVLGGSTLGKDEKTILIILIQPLFAN